jgi:hypothetical protein
VEELIFFAVLIFFSIIESIARSRKQRKGGGQLPELPGEVPPEWEREVGAQRPGPRPAPQPRPRMSDVPSYDDDASFDARASSEAERSFDDVASSDEERRRRASSSESMIPSDIWEEITGLAREAKVELPAPRPKPQPRFPPTPKTQVPQPPRRSPQPSRPVPKSVPKPAQKTPPPPRPQVAPKRPTIAERAAALEGTAAHPIHLSHAGYGTDPSERARSAQDVLQSPVPAHADASAVRNQLRGQGGSALRQALILSEVLGPPVSSKPDPYSE